MMENEENWSITSAGNRENVERVSDKELKDDQLEQSEDSYDISLMLLVPYVAFLIAESLNLSGYLVLINSAFLLSLYGIPNME